MLLLLPVLLLLVLDNLATPVTVNSAVVLSYRPRLYSMSNMAGVQLLIPTCSFAPGLANQLESKLPLMLVPLYFLHKLLMVPCLDVKALVILDQRGCINYAEECWGE